MKRSLSHKRVRQAGFSLFEILVALAIVSAVVLITVRFVPQQRLNAEVARVSADIKALLSVARAHAAATHTSQLVTFDLERRVVRHREEEITLPASLRIELTTAREISNSASRAILFFADGSGSGGTVSIGAGEKTRRFRVSWLTGSILDER